MGLALPLALVALLGAPAPPGPQIHGRVFEDDAEDPSDVGDGPAPGGKKKRGGKAGSGEGSSGSAPARDA